MDVDTNKPPRLVIGDDIYSGSDISIVHGSSWGWGFYHDHSHAGGYQDSLWYITHQGIVQAVIVGNMDVATMEYGRLQEEAAKALA